MPSVFSGDNKKLIKLALIVLNTIIKRVTLSISTNSHPLLIFPEEI